MATDLDHIQRHSRTFEDNQALVEEGLIFLTGAGEGSRTLVISLGS